MFKSNIQALRDFLRAKTSVRSPSTSLDQVVGNLADIEIDVESPSSHMSISSSTLLDPQLARLKTALSNLGIHSRSDLALRLNKLEAILFGSAPSALFGIFESNQLIEREDLKSHLQENCSQAQIEFSFFKDEFDSADLRQVMSLKFSDMNDLGPKIIHELHQCPDYTELTESIVLHESVEVSLESALGDLFQCHKFYSKYLLMTRPSNSWSWDEHKLEMFKKVSDVEDYLPTLLENAYLGQTLLKANIAALQSMAITEGVEDLSKLGVYLSIIMATAHAKYFPGTDANTSSGAMLEAIRATARKSSPGKSKLIGFSGDPLDPFGMAWSPFAILPLVSSEFLPSLLIEAYSNNLAKVVLTVCTYHFLDLGMSDRYLYTRFTSNTPLFSDEETKQFLQSFYETNRVTQNDSPLVPYKRHHLPENGEPKEEDDYKYLQFYKKRVRKDVFEKLDALNIRFPEFHEVTEKVRRKCAFSLQLDKAFKTQPMVLVGPPGLGKTLYLKELSKALDLPKLSLSATQITCGSLLMGTQRTWGNTQLGLLTQQMIKTRVSNGIVAFDELSQLKDVYGIGINPKAALMALLETDEARDFIDASSRTNVDMSLHSWFFTANNITNLDPILLSRMDIVNIAPLDRYTDPESVRAILDITLDRMDIAGEVSVILDDLCCQVALEYLNHKGQKRRIGKILEDLISDAALHADLSQPIQIKHSHLRAMLNPSKGVAGPSLG